jgi:hypothetical protein
MNAERSEGAFPRRAWERGGKERGNEGKNPTADGHGWKTARDAATRCCDVPADVWRSFLSAYTEIDAGDPFFPWERMNPFRPSAG